MYSSAQLQLFYNVCQNPVKRKSFNIYLLRQLSETKHSYHIWLPVALSVKASTIWHYRQLVLKLLIPRSSSVVCRLFFTAPRLSLLPLFLRELSKRNLTAQHGKAPSVETICPLNTFLAVETPVHLCLISVSSSHNYCLFSLFTFRSSIFHSSFMLSCGRVWQDVLQLWKSSCEKEHGPSQPSLWISPEYSW